MAELSMAYETSGLNFDNEGGGTYGGVEPVGYHELIIDTNQGHRHGPQVPQLMQDVPRDNGKFTNTNTNSTNLKSTPLNNITNNESNTSTKKRDMFEQSIDDVSTDRGMSRIQSVRPPATQVPIEYMAPSHSQYGPFTAPAPIRKEVPKTQVLLTKPEIKHEVKTDVKSNAKYVTQKLAVMVVVIIIALSTHSLIERFLDNYVSSIDWTPDRETFLRIAYPLIICLLLWFLTRC
jgi:hypothetical protein